MWTILAHAGEAHETLVAGPRNLHELWRTWGWEPLSIFGLALSAVWYAVGARKLWRAADASLFAGGWIALFIALVSPLHPWGQMLFSAHMTQHEVLMLVAAPLLVLSSPMPVFLHALPSQWSHALGRFSNTPVWKRFWTTISNPFAAFAIHGLILWLWHIPALFQATLHNEFIHALQHCSFLSSALLFWWAVIHVKDRTFGYAAAILYMFATALHSNILGALLTFATSVWYPDYARTAQYWGMTALQDQQLGGLIMWVPAGIVYIIAGLALVAGWMRESERRAQKRETALLTPTAEALT